jgi:hypothetical protein
MISRKCVITLAVASILLASEANGCDSSTPSIGPCPGELTCPNEQCCPAGYPFECGGQCYTNASVCGSSYVTCAGTGADGGEAGVPCSPGDHPAWMQGECASVATCNCSLNSCVHSDDGGCCAGFDLGTTFIPCEACGDCAEAAAMALQQCGCSE